MIHLFRRALLVVCCFLSACTSRLESQSRREDPAAYQPDEGSKAAIDDQSASESEIGAETVGQPFEMVYTSIDGIVGEVVDIGKGVNSERPGTPPYTASVRMGSIVKLDSLTATLVGVGSTELSVRDMTGSEITLKIVVYPALSWVSCPSALGFQEDAKLKAAGGVPPLKYKITQGIGTIDAVTGQYTRTWSAGTSTIEVSDIKGNAITCGPIALTSGVAQIGIPKSSGGDFAGSSGVDSQGNILVTAMTYGAWPGFVSAGGSNDLVYAKLDRVGRRLWSTQLGSPGADDPGQIVADATSYYTVATVRGSVGNAAAIGGTDVLITKLDAATGSVIWATMFGSSLDERSSRIALGPAGKLWVLGSTTGTVEAGVANAGLNDAFIVRINTETGGIEYVDQLGTAADDASIEPGGIAVNAEGAVVTIFRVGSPFLGKAFPGPYPSAIMLRRADGSVVWTKSTTCTSGQDYGAAFAPDGNIMLLLGCTEVLPGASPPESTPLYATIEKVSIVDGSTMWINQEGANSNNYPNSFAVGSDGALFVTSVSTGSTYAGIENPGDWSALLYSVESTGATRWRRFLGVAQYDGAYGASVLPNGDFLSLRDHCAEPSSGFDPNAGTICVEVRSASDGTLQ